MRDVLTADAWRCIAAVLAVAPLPGFAVTWGAKYLVRAFHVEQIDVGHYLWLPLVGFDVAALLFGDLAARQKRAPGAPPILLFSIAMLLASSLVFLPYATTPWSGMAIIAVSLAGSGGIYTIAATDVLSRTPRERIAVTSSLLAASQSLAIIIANPLIGISVTATLGFDQSAIALGIWTIPGSLIWILSRRR